jgi:acetyl-CoA C-acetyltransferase
MTGSGPRPILRGAQERAPQDDAGGEIELSRQTEYFLACQGPPDRPEKSWKQETPAENDLTIKGKAYIAGIYEHPTRHAPDKSTAQLHAEVAKGAIEDAGLTKADIDGYFCAGDAPGGVMNMVDYLGLKVRHFDSTDTGGCSYLVHLGHAAEAIAAGKCSIALITLAGKPRTGPMPPRSAGAEADFEIAYGATTHNVYGMCAMRHMHDYGTTSEQLAWIKVAASHHAQYNPHAMLKEVVTVEDVLNSPMISDPLHRMDCCVVTDGGGALIVTTPEIAKSLKKPLVRMIGHGEAMKGPRGGKDLDLTYSAGVWSGPRAFEEAGVTPKDIKYASIYDSFTITVLMQLEDIGFCKKGEGGKFVADGNLISGVGKLPFNTDGGGLCSNHPVNRGGMTKIIEAVRQLRGEAHPKVQVKNCDLAIAHGTGGLLGVRHAASTCILERA